MNRELWAFAADEHEILLYCECGRDDCTASLPVTRDEFAATRLHADCALIDPAHKARFEPVLERHARFLVVADLEAVETTVRETPLAPPAGDPPAA